MNKPKTIFVVGVTILFLGLSVLPSLNAEFLESDESRSISSYSNSYEEITVYRYGPNGDIKPLKIQITSIAGENFAELVSDKCRELCEKDEELQQIIQSEESFEVKSEGKGWFFSFRPIIWKNRKVLWRTVLMCRYFYEGDYTKVRDNETSEWIPVLEDVHEIRIIGFTGYVYVQRFRVFRSMIVQGYTSSLEWRTPKWPRNPWAY
jgi:hypothetical protein